MHPVSEYEAPLAPLHPRVGVALSRSVVHAPLAVCLDVGAAHGYDVGLHLTALQQPPEQVVDNPQVGLLPELVSEVGEEAVAGCVLPESA